MTSCLGDDPMLKLCPVCKITFRRTSFNHVVCEQSTGVRCPGMKPLPPERERFSSRGNRQRRRYELRQLDKQ